MNGTSPRVSGDIFEIIRDPTYVGGITRTFEVEFSRLTVDQRFDADRFDPKYDKFFRRLHEAGRVARLGDMLREKPRRGVQPTYDANGEIFVINSQQIHADKIDLESCSRTTPQLVSLKRSRGRIKKYDVLLNSTGYITVGRCQAWLEDVDAIVDSHVTVLRPNDEIDPVYLAAFLNSRLGYLQTERAWTGSSGQIELRREAIEQFQVLIPSPKGQLTVRRDIEAAHTARLEAKRLWQKATEAVEAGVMDAAGS